MSKRLYVVHVEFEFAVLAASEDEARGFVDQAMREESFIGDDAGVVPAKSQGYCMPDGWEGDGLVYGADKDTTWDDAVDAEREADEAEKRLSEFAAKQVALFVD